MLPFTYALITVAGIIALSVAAGDIRSRAQTKSVLNRAAMKSSKKGMRGAVERSGDRILIKMEKRGKEKAALLARKTYANLVREFKGDAVEVELYLFRKLGTSGLTKFVLCTAKRKIN